MTRLFTYKCQILKPGRGNDNVYFLDIDTGFGNWEQKRIIIYNAPEGAKKNDWWIVEMSRHQMSPSPVYYTGKVIHVYPQRDLSTKSVPTVLS